MSGLLGLISLRAFAHGPFGHGHRRRHRRHLLGAMSAQDLREHAGERIDWVLTRLDASRQRIEADRILDRVTPALHALGKEHEELHRRARQAFEQDDRDALEKLRVEGIGFADRASELALQSLLELYDVLGAKQQAELRAHLPHG